MRGWLIVNSFMDSEKFSNLYSMLLEASKKQDVSLELLTGADICDTVGGGFSGRGLPDFVLFWDKDIMLAQMLEDSGLRLFNRADAIEACDNKAKTAILLAKAGIPIPKTIIAPKTFEGIGYSGLGFLDKAIEKLGLPLVVKEAFGSFGRQVYLADSREQAARIITEAGHKDLVLQEFISSSRGRDVRINVVGGRVSSAMLRYNDNDFRSNITNGGSMKSYTPSESQRKTALAAARALGLDFAGVDILFGENDEPLVCEVNSNPHFKSTLDCTGVDMADDIIRHIRSELK